MTQIPQYQEFWPGAAPDGAHPAKFYGKRANSWNGKTVALTNLFLILFAGLTSLTTILVMQALHPARYPATLKLGEGWQAPDQIEALQRPTVRQLVPRSDSNSGTLETTDTLQHAPTHRPAALLSETLRQLSLANVTNTYSQFHRLAAPAFQRANSAQKLRDVFAWMRHRQIQLSTASALRPFSVATAKIDKNGFLNISGVVETRPVGLKVNVAYQSLAGAWKLFGVHVALQR